MKIFIWIIGTVFIAGFLAADVILFRSDLRLLFLLPLFFACFMSLYRLFVGPTNADRAAAIKVTSVLIISFCGILALFDRWDVFIDIAIAWTIQAFVATLILAKFIEGRPLDD